MFTGLKLLDAQVAARKERAGSGISLKALRAAHRQSFVTSRIEKSLLQSQALTQEFKDLRRLHKVLSIHGVNKALMEFVNPGNKGLSRVVKNLPANESLDLVCSSPKDSRTKGALEGLAERLETEPQVVAQWMHASAADIEELLECSDEQLKDVGDSISSALMECEDSYEPLANSHVIAVTSSIALERFEAILDILPDMDAVVSNPTDRDGTDAYKAKVTSLIAKIGPYVGLAVDPENPYLIVAAPVTEEHQAHLSTLTDLGYDRSNIITLLKKSDNLIDELNGLIERKEKTVTHIQTAADAASLVDNLVPPAVDGAIESFDPSQCSEVPADGLTQADVYHAQVASHLFSLTVLMTVSVGIVEEVLGLVHNTTPVVPAPAE